MSRAELVALFTVEVLAGLPHKLHVMPSAEIRAAVQAAATIADIVLENNKEYEDKLKAEADDRHIRSSNIHADYE